MNIRHFLLALALFLLPMWSGAGQNVSYEVQGVVYDGYFVSAGKHAPLVLLIHDWDGLTAYEIKRSEMLAQMGYSVFAADLFGSGIRPTEVKDKRQHTGELYSNREKMRALVKGALDAARQQGANTTQIAIAGYCFGGAVALEIARNESALGEYQPRAYATFHGGLKTPPGQSYHQTQGSIIVFHGASDTVISMDDFSALARELEQHSVAHEMLSYGGAPHAFTVFDSTRYREQADKLSWRRFGFFLQEVLGK